MKKAEKEGCELFVITGDLFDNINSIKVSDVKRIASILSLFSNTVLILPGNHDYYSGEEKVWKDFLKAISSIDSDYLVLNEFRKYELETSEETIEIYPAFCQSKHREENNLEWIKNGQIDEYGVINIGVAHGALEGIAPDMDNKYFFMTREELLSIPMDAWLIGHTHIPYPDNLKEEEDITGEKIFNPGTHEQTDLGNRTEGNGFILTIKKENGKATVSARKYVSGKIHFYDEPKIVLRPESDTVLVDTLRARVGKRDKNAVIRLTITGSARQTEYENRKQIYQEVLGDFLDYEIDDDELSEEITVEKIRDEYAETSFAAQFMECLIDQPMELQMVYQLLDECKDR